MPRFRARYIARSRYCYTAWSIKPTYVYEHTWGLPGRASLQPRVYRRLTEEQAVKLLGRALGIGEIVCRY